MEDMNMVALVCRLGRDPEVRQLPSGESVTSLWVAINGRKEDDTSWIGVSVFGKSADAAAQHLSKGRRIGVKGRLRVRQWEAQDGSKRREAEVVCESWYFLDSKGAEDAAPAPADDLAEVKRTLGATESDSDIPF